MKRLSKEINLKKCTGCFLCRNLCASNAIDYSYDSLGFRYPVINTELCKKCNKCVNNCPTMTKINEHSLPDCYAVQNIDEIRAISSSGGVFFAVAEAFLNLGGYVCGATFIDGEVKHIVINDASQLTLLCKSKYVQSTIDDVFKPIKQLLMQGKRVLFSGTPCQCHAISVFCGETENLYLIDLLCMGVPSHKLLDKYISESIDMNVKSVDFRHKPNNMWNYSFSLSFFDGTNKIIIPNEDCTFFNFFNKGLSIRESCVECEYATVNRVGDITLGDFWNIKSYDESLDDGYGTSLVLVNDYKGEFLVRIIENKVKLIKKLPIEVAVQLCSSLSSPMGDSYSRQRFKQKCNDESYEEMMISVMNEKADCGILNYWPCDDNGAILTAYALQVSLGKMGFTSLLIDYGVKRNPRGISRHFEAQYLKTALSIPKADNKTLNDRFDNFLVGSDQVFRREWVPDSFFLDFVNDEKKKIAVAASFGKENVSCGYQEKKQMSYWLRRFDAVSTREFSGIRILKSLGIKGIQIIDPVFWIQSQEYIKNFSLSNRKQNMFSVYYRDINEINIETIIELAKSEGCFVKVLDDNTEVTDFVESICNSRYVITDSYHGVCFSVIFHVPFLCTMNEKRGNDRFYSLIEGLGIPSSAFIEDSELNSKKLRDIVFDWDEIDYRVEKEGIKARSWLYKTIKKRKGKAPQIRAEVYKYKIELVNMFKHFINIYIWWISKKKLTVCYGAGNYGKKAITEFGDRIDFFIDRDKNKKFIDRYCVYQFGKAQMIMNEDTDIIITAAGNLYEEIRSILVNKGYKKIFSIEEYSVLYHSRGDLCK
ncbi:polysaccharide pyruvyl transferase family protein [Butyrivibrio sp. AE3006]|uniref:polysaccharide pyruvyl transferase family protein n=1 Tax=Butyrivibrio sp. AE3006 TaxID=1280673 RepID=UPI000416DDE3|nr:polysaccharide pyruvyl transferase family protein [Butyrivibrio sp. AE3006]